MSELEQKVLDCLCENSHYTNKEISLIVNASEKEVKEIIEKLENNGTILKYGAVLNLEENKKVNTEFGIKQVRRNYDVPENKESRGHASALFVKNRMQSRKNTIY